MNIFIYYPTREVHGHDYRITLSYVDLPHVTDCCAFYIL